MDAAPPVLALWTQPWLSGRPPEVTQDHPILSARAHAPVPEAKNYRVTRLVMEKLGAQRPKGEL